MDAFNVTPKGELRLAPSPSLRIANVDIRFLKAIDKRSRFDRRVGKDRNLSYVSVLKKTFEIRKLVDEIVQEPYQLKATYKQSISVMTVSNTVLTGHCFITLCLMNCWIGAVIYTAAMIK